MKALITFGVIGLVLYAYAQLTSISVVVVRDVHIYFMPYGEYAAPRYVRDWTVGLVWGIIGAILLGIGVYRLRRYRRARKPAT
jgi:hypothetical protein